MTTQDLDPGWLRALANEDGNEAMPGQSVRPVYGEHLLALHKERVRQRSQLPKHLDGEAEEVRFGDGRNLDDVLDHDVDGGKPYLTLGKIGEGGMGIVLSARQRSTMRQVAIKALHRDQRRETYQAIFQEECQITAGLEHAHIPPVYDAGVDFMVMKRLHGRSLEDRLWEDDASENVPLHIEALLKVCDAVAYAHARGVVHRDLKGENIMVGDYGEVWVMDWGLAAGFAPDRDGLWLAPPVSCRQDMCAGTPLCIAPEVACADPSAIGPGIDLFMLGALLYRTLCGHYPYEASDATSSLRLAAKRSQQGLLVRAPRAPFRLVQAAERAMAWDPQDRGLMLDFTTDLRTWLHTSGAATEAARLVETARKLLAHTGTSADSRYRALSQALVTAERAAQLAPELKDAHDVTRQARDAFANAATEAGDMTLADLIRRGFAIPSGPR